MGRGLVWYVVGSVLLFGLAGCGHSWFEQREPWRREAELACLRSGVIEEGPTLETLRPIDGPGVCGADFPIRVSALGFSQLLGFAEDVRPPGLIPQHSPGLSAPTAPLELGPARSIAPRMPDRGLPPAEVGRVPLFPEHRPVAAGPVNIAPPATLACPLISSLDSWIAAGIQPAALRWIGKPVVEIKQISAYSCRSMNGQRGAPISEHAFGNALDIAAFTFADGRKLTVKDGWGGAIAERAFLHDVQASACRQFATVLAPGSNAFHYDHIHVDLARHASGRSICNPSPVPGDVIARAHEPLTTGTLRPSRSPSRALNRVMQGRLEEYDDMPGSD